MKNLLTATINIRRSTMTQRTLLFLIIMLSLSGCGNSYVKISLMYSKLPRIEYCDLPNYENKEAILTGKYTGMMEYWSLQPIDSRKQDLSVDFDIRDYFYNMPGQLKEKLNRSAKYFIVTAVGKYERCSKGYGHLSHLKSRFIVSDLLDVKVIAR